MLVPVPLVLGTHDWRRRDKKFLKRQALSLCCLGLGRVLEVLEGLRVAPDLEQTEEVRAIDLLQHIEADKTGTALGARVQLLEHIASGPRVRGFKLHVEDDELLWLGLSHSSTNEAGEHCNNQEHECQSFNKHAHPSLSLACLSLGNPGGEPRPGSSDPDQEHWTSARIRRRRRKCVVNAKIAIHVKREACRI